MSHFTVLVAASDECELEEVLAPYEESPRNDKYLEFRDCTQEVLDEWQNGAMEGTFHDGKLLSKWEARHMNLLDAEYDEYPMCDFYDSIEELAKNYYRYRALNIDGETRYGYYHNPNAQWDWWEIGGRWWGMLVDKDGNEVNDGTIAELELKALRQNNVDSALATRAKIMAMVAEGHDTKEKLIAEVRNRDDFMEFWGVDLDPDNWCDEEKVRDEAYNRALTFALLTPQGWLERGNMGWWGIVSNENDDYDHAFWKTIESLDPDQHLYLVDCHI